MHFQRLFSHEYFGNENFSGCILKTVFLLYIVEGTGYNGYKLGTNVRKFFAGLATEFDQYFQMGGDV